MTPHRLTRRRLLTWGLGGAAAVVGAGAAGLELASHGAAKFPHLHRALASVRAGRSGDFKIGMLMDSAIYGFHDLCGIGTGQVLARLLSDQGFPAALGMVIPTNPSGTGGVDRRWSAGIGWSETTQDWSFGGRNPGYAAAAGTAANTLTFTPSNGATYDTYDIYYLVAPGLGTCHVNANGSSDTTLVTDGTAGIGMTTISVPASSSGSIRFGTVTVSSVEILGVEPSLSGTPKIRIGNMGVSGSTSADWTNTTSNAGFGPLDAIRSYAADVWIICAPGNDINASISLPTSLANLATIAAACKDSGADLFFNSMIPSDNAAISTAAEASMSAAIKAFCAAKGYGFIDIFTAWGGRGGYAELQPLGYYYDQAHPSAHIGYPHIARLELAALLAA